MRGGCKRIVNGIQWEMTELITKERIAVGSVKVFKAIISSTRAQQYLRWATVATIDMSRKEGVGWSLPFLVSTNTAISETRTESEALLHFYKLLPLIIANLKNTRTDDKSTVRLKFNVCS